MSLTTDRDDQRPEEYGELHRAFAEGIFAAAQPGAVFGPPVVSGVYTVITASEVVAGGGFGSGWGKGGSAHAASDTTGGGGAGGGGGANARPVAAIVIGPDGVAVRPIFDVTKLTLAGLTAGGALLAAYLRLRAKAR